MDLRKSTPQQSKVRLAKEAAAALAKQEAENAQAVTGYNYDHIGKINGAGKIKIN